MNSRTLAKTGDKVESPGRTRPKWNTKRQQQKGRVGHLKAIFVRSMCAKDEQRVVLGHPVYSTRETSAWLGSIAMLQSQNRPKRSSMREGAAVIFFENDAESVEQLVGVIWKE